MPQFFLPLYLVNIFEANLGLLVWPYELFGLTLVDART